MLRPGRLAPLACLVGVGSAALAAASRDGKWVIASARAEGKDFAIATNAVFTCLHTDSTIEVAARQAGTARQRFYFLKGSLADLLERFRGDSGLR